MRVLVSTDMEGASGLDNYQQILPFYGELYETGRNLLTEDVNAAIRGLRLGGATEIDVIDGHGYGIPPFVNIIRDKIEPGVKVLAAFESKYSRAKPFPIHSYDAQVIVGAHAMAGTVDGFLSHTVSPITALRMNGRFVGETELSAYWAGYFGVPTILVTGDDAVITEAKHFLPGIEGAIVKKAKTRDYVECLPINEAQSIIEKSATRALKGLKSFGPYKIPEPIYLDIVFASSEYSIEAMAIPRTKLTHDRIVSYIAEDYPEAMTTFSLSISLSSQLYLRKRLQESEEVNRITGEWWKEIIYRWATESPPFPVIKF